MVKSVKQGDLQESRVVEDNKPCTNFIIPIGQEPSQCQPSTAIKMYHEEEELVGVSDTGSEINVMDKRYWDTHLSSVPVERKLTGRKAMYNANRGSRNFWGCTLSVKFRVGQHFMLMNIYNIKDVAFSFILGQPWIVDHQVLIEQQPRGAIVTFR
jgi:hypothetical protein